MKKLLLIPAILLTLKSVAQSPGEVQMCRTSEAMNALYEKDPKAKLEQENFEIFIENFIKQRSAQKPGAEACYVIPVVFHVYGTVQSGKAVNNSLIINAVADLNKDFHGANADYATVHNSFLSIRDKMSDITFALALKDPSGNPTNGIVYYPAKGGYGTGSYDADIMAEAWDNYKYMNIYIMNDLYNNSVYNNSGIAWLPNTSMSNDNLARIVYNGAYLGANAAPNLDFASVLTHEYGHWLDLYHTFDGGCTSPNDFIADTPPCDYGGASYGCHPSASASSPLNCTGNLINAENYMDYSGAGGCYKMFTQQQVLRMYAGLMHPSRKPLWQPSNLVATGLSHLCASSGVGINNLSLDIENVNIYPNPSTNYVTVLTTNTNLVGSSYNITDQLGRVVLKGKITSQEMEINISELPKGVYFIGIGNQSANKKIIKL